MNIFSQTWEVKKEHQIGLLRVRVWLFYVSQEGVHVAHIVNNRVEVTLVKEGDVEEPPTFELPDVAWMAIERSFIDKKVREKNEVEAELTATKYHLEDMRKIVLKKYS